jgi:hypothetical protein
MRWGMPNLLQEVERMNYVKCKRLRTDGKFFNMRISAGKLFADATHLVKLYEYTENSTDFLLEFNLLKCNFVTCDFNIEKNGTPVLFEPLYVK